MKRSRRVRNWLKTNLVAETCCPNGSGTASVTGMYTATATAEKLVISPYTVNTHIQHIYRKLNIHKRSELISYLHRSA